MGLWNTNIPGYINEKSNIIRLVLSTAAFALIFINIYKPFTSEKWYNVSATKFFFFSSLIILTGVLVVVLSRIIMYHYSKQHSISVGIYCIWVTIEILAMSGFYTLYTLSVNHGKDVFDTLRGCVINTSLILLLPYAVLWLYFSWQDKVRKLEFLEENPLPSSGNSILAFNDEKGDFRFSVKKENLLYLESADNYIVVWYLNKGVVSKYMIRNSLKAMETAFSDTHIIRCHRSFMVNFDQVKVIKREKNGVYLQMDIPNVPDIPISKTYSEKTMNWFMNFPQ